MEIKIKHLRQFALISLSLFLAGMNYLNFVHADERTAGSSTEACVKSVDSDCDGLTNSEEASYGTNPQKYDSDDDGYSDGVEVKSGYNPLVKAPNDKIGVITTNSGSLNDLDSINTIGSTPSATQVFSDKLNEFINSKKDQAITTTDIQKFTSEQITEQTAESVFNIGQIPTIQRSEIEIIPQQYTNLNVEDRKEAMMKDAVRYFFNVGYILESSLTEPITNADEFKKFQGEFLSHVQTLATQNPDYNYFSNLGYKLALERDLLKNVKVPETMVDIHIKFIQLIDAYLSLRNSAISSTSDSVGSVINLAKISQLISYTDSFLSNDIVGYFENIN